LIITIALFNLTSVGQAAVFWGVGNLSSPIPGGFVQGLSPDGSMAVGFSRNLAGNAEATRWTSSIGLQSLGFEGYAVAASNDGAWIVGASQSGANTQAFRWSSATGRLDHPYPIGSAGTTGQANAVSADGNVIVGKDGPDVRGVLWRSSSGFAAETLNDLQGGVGASTSFGVSSNGLVAVGASSSILGTQAVWWDISGTPVVHALGFLTLGASNFSQAIDASADGQVIIGNSLDGSGSMRAFRWTNADGMVSLGLPIAPWVVASVARATNADGSIVVGYASNSSASYFEATYWSQATGMQFMKDFLSSHGLSPALGGWTLTETYAVSDDGLTFAGRGVNPFGKEEGWVATIPEASSVTLCITVILAGIIGILVRYLNVKLRAISRITSNSYKGTGWSNASLVSTIVRRETLAYIVTSLSLTNVTQGETVQQFGDQGVDHQNYLEFLMAGGWRIVNVRPTAGGPSTVSAFGGENDPAIADSYGGRGGNGLPAIWVLPLLGEVNYSEDGRDGGSAQATARSWGDTLNPITSIASSRGGKGGDGPQGNFYHGQGGQAESDAFAVNISPLGQAVATSNAYGGDSGLPGNWYPGELFWYFGGNGGNARAMAQSEGGEYSLAHATAVGGSSQPEYRINSPSPTSIPNYADLSKIGHGGSAVAEANGHFSGAGGSVKAYAFGGHGGASTTQSGDGNWAWAKAHGETTAGSVLVETIQQGGSGGLTYRGGRAGDGIDSVIIDATTGSAPGTLSLNQSAIGGDAGFVQSFDAGISSAGRAGNAISSLTQSNPGGGDLILTTSANGGRGGNATDGFGSNGGDAAAIANGSDSDRVYVSAYATGGAVSEVPGHSLGRYGDAYSEAVANAVQHAESRSVAFGNNARSVSSSTSLGTSIAISGATQDHLAPDAQSTRLFASATASGSDGYAQAAVTTLDGFQLSAFLSVGSTTMSAAELAIGDGETFLTGVENASISATLDPTDLSLSSFTIAARFPIDAAHATHQYSFSLSLPYPWSIDWSVLSPSWLVGDFDNATITFSSINGPLYINGSKDSIYQSLLHHKLYDISSIHINVSLSNSSQSFGLTVSVPEASSVLLATLALTGLVVIAFSRRIHVISMIITSIACASTSQAAVITYSTDIEFGGRVATRWDSVFHAQHYGESTSSPIRLPKLDPALGVLLSVRISLDTYQTSTLTITNYSSQLESGVFRWDPQVIIRHQSNSIGFAAVIGAAQNRIDSLLLFDSQLIGPYSFSHRAQLTSDFGSMPLAPFIGIGDIPVTLNQRLEVFGITAPHPEYLVFETNGIARGTVRVEYEIVPVPEAHSSILMAIASVLGVPVVFRAVRRAARPATTACSS
jgi:probable HAF family extracellular repeat protein